MSSTKVVTWRRVLESRPRIDQKTNCSPGRVPDSRYRETTSLFDLLLVSGISRQQNLSRLCSGAQPSLKFLIWLRL